MRIIELRNINHMKSSIVYIRKYDCDLVLEIFDGPEAVPMHFEIELDCFGNRSIRMNLMKEINYPLIPLKNKVISYIKSQDEEGLLPC